MNEMLTCVLAREQNVAEHPQVPAHILDDAWRAFNTAKYHKTLQFEPVGTFLEIHNRTTEEAMDWHAWSCQRASTVTIFGADMIEASQASPEFNVRFHGAAVCGTANVTSCHSLASGRTNPSWKRC